MAVLPVQLSKSVIPTEVSRRTRHAAEGSWQHPSRSRNVETHGPSRRSSAYSASLRYPFLLLPMPFPTCTYIRRPTPPHLLPNSETPPLSLIQPLAPAPLSH